MTGGKHKTVAVGPLRIFGVMFQVFCPERKRCGCCAQRHTGMAGFGLFDRIGSEKADGINTLFL